MITHTFNVEGMHCASCETLIVDEMVEADGVESAEASYKDGKVTVTFDESKIDLTSLARIIKEEGFTVRK